MNAWVEEELTSVNLSDARLDVRMHKILDRVGSKPGVSIPAACKGWNETSGAYRFFNNKKVTQEKVLSAHTDATHKRMSDHKVVLCIQDTTEMDYTGRELKDAGPLSIEERIGIFNHVTLAVTPTRLCLGVLDTYMWSRDFYDLTKNDKRKQKPIEEKESYRWLEGYRKLCKLSEQFSETTLVSISDREGDIYECFLEASQQEELSRAEYIIRGCQNRSLPGKDGDGCYKKLMQDMSEKPIIGHVEFKLPKSENRTARKVVQSVQTGSILLKAPYRKGVNLPEVEINAVLTQEINPPEGEEPIVWLLLSSLVVETFEQACIVVKYYLCRWEIEIYFKVLKSGCKIEDRQFETAKGMKSCIALYMIVAWRVLFVTMLGRECPDLPCTVLFEDNEWKAVYMIVKKEILPESPPSLGNLIIMIAGLGGHLNRKCDGPPGPKTMWVGLQRMVDFALAWQSFGPTHLGRQKDVYKP